MLDFGSNIPVGEVVSRVSLVGVSVEVQSMYVWRGIWSSAVLTL